MFCYEHNAVVRRIPGGAIAGRCVDRAGRWIVAGRWRRLTPSGRLKAQCDPIPRPVFSAHRFVRARFISCDCWDCWDCWDSSVCGGFAPARFFPCFPRLLRLLRLLEHRLRISGAGSPAVCDWVYSSADSPVIRCGVLRSVLTGGWGVW